MMSFTTFVFLTLINVCVWASDQTSLDICHEYGGYYRDQNCKCFYQCNRYQVWRTCCPTGQSFDDRNRVCAPDSQVVCQSTQSMIRVRQTLNHFYQCYAPNGLFRHEECSKYWHCYNQRLYEMTCPEGSLWNDDLKICVLSQFSTCNTLTVNTQQTNAFLNIPTFMSIPKNQLQGYGVNAQQPAGYAEQVDKHLADILAKNKWLASATYLTLDQYGRVIYGVTKVSTFSVKENNETTTERSAGNVKNSTEYVSNNTNTSVPTERTTNIVKADKSEIIVITSMIAPAESKIVETKTTSLPEEDSTFGTTTETNATNNENVVNLYNAKVETNAPEGNVETTSTSDQTIDGNGFESSTTERNTETNEFVENFSENRNIYSTVPTTERPEPVSPAHNYETNGILTESESQTSSTTEESITESTSQSVMSSESTQHYTDSTITTPKTNELIMGTTESYEDSSHESTAQSSPTESSTELHKELTLSTHKSDATEGTTHTTEQSERISDSSEPLTTGEDTSNDWTHSETTSTGYSEYSEYSTESNFNTELAINEENFETNEELVTKQITTERDSFGLIEEHMLRTPIAGIPVLESTTPTTTTMHSSMATFDPELDANRDENKVTETTTEVTTNANNNIMQPKVNYMICKEVGGYYADESDCKCFYVCDLSFRAYRHCCPDGLLFNENAEDLLCDYPDSVVCRDGSNLPVRLKRAIYFKRFVQKVNLNHLKYN